MKGLRKGEGSNTSNHKNDGLMEDRFLLCDNEGRHREDWLSQVVRPALQSPSQPFQESCTLQT